MTPSQTPTFKELADYKIVGKYVPRRDIPQKVDGSAKFALDTRLPDMAYASVLRSPVPGGSLVSLDDSAAKSMPGVIDVVKIPATPVTNMLGEMRASEAVVSLPIVIGQRIAHCRPSKLIGARPNTTLSQASQSTSNLIGIFHHALIAPTTV